MNTGGEVKDEEEWIGLRVKVVDALKLVFSSGFGFRIIYLVPSLSETTTTRGGCSCQWTDDDYEDDEDKPVSRRWKIIQII